LVVVLLTTIAPAIAETKLSGVFVAKQACAALQSIKKQTNPGDMHLSPGKGYKLLAENTEPPTHYWIVVPGAPDPDFRWVPVSCGSIASDTPDVLPPTNTTAPTPPAPVTPGKAEYVLAISWEPAFCEGLPDKTECVKQTASSYEATHLSLHGLWPQPRNTAYCNVSAADQASDKAHDWAALPPVTLSAATRTDLDQAMPGTQSLLERHEWIVHGTCSGSSQDNYFHRATLFLGTIDNSAVGALFASHIGQRLDGSAIRHAFDVAFGKGAGDRVRLACDRDGDRQLISEITIGLRGDVMGNGGIGELIAASSPTDPGCNGGIVDQAGH
jgi:ribonuclease T2